MVRASFTGMEVNKDLTSKETWLRHSMLLDVLRKDEEVTIVSADKGRSVVVMDKDEYKEKVSVLLNDTNTYLKITDKLKDRIQHQASKKI